MAGEISIPPFREYRKFCARQAEKRKGIIFALCDLGENVGNVDEKIPRRPWRTCTRVHNREQNDGRVHNRVHFNPLYFQRIETFQPWESQHFG